MTTTTTEQPVLAEIIGEEDRVTVTFPYSPDRVTRIKKVPSARFIPKDKPNGPGWRLNLDLPTMRRLREVFGDELRLGEQLKAWGHRQVKKEQALTDLSQADDAALERISEEFGAWLRPYQRADIRFMATTNTINANQPRTGKTPTTIGSMIEAGLEWGQHLVFAPVTSLRSVWEDGIKEAYAKQGLDEPTVLTGDTPKERVEAIKEAKQMAEEGSAFWLVLNPYHARLKRQKVEGTSGDNIQYEEVLVSPELIEVEWDSITVDEFHLMGLSNPTTLGARGVNQIAEITQPAKLHALSGTPMGGKPIKLWGALHFLNPNEFTSRWHWARHWLVINHNGYGHKIEGIMPGREEDFYNHLKPYLVRRTQREALPGLPEVNRVNVWCGMTAKQREQYITFAQDAEWRMEGAEEEGRLTATNILAEYTRLKQFADAYCEVHRTGREVNGIPELKVKHTVDSGKIEQLIEKLLEENVFADDDDEPKAALVFTQFITMTQAVTEAINAKAGREIATNLQGITGARRDEIIASFQAGSPDAPRVLVMNTKAGGTALTLDRADTVHLLDETWVPDDQEQAENRVTPTTEEKMAARVSTGVYYYRTRNSIEEHIQKLVADKAMNNRTILDLRRRMQKELAEAEAAAKESGDE